MKKGITVAAFFAVVYCFSACSETGERIENADSISEMATEDTAVVYDKDRTGDRLSTETPVDVDVVHAWTDQSYEREPVIDEPELRNSGVELRGNDSLNVYSVEQDIMFDTDKAQIRPAGEEKLQKIANTIRKRSKQGQAEVFVYGHTDARASKPYNKELGRDRAKSVADWLVNKGNFDRSKLNVKSMGETQPVATNETAAGMQKNRRVEIVVRNNRKPAGQ